MNLDYSKILTSAYDLLQQQNRLLLDLLALMSETLPYSTSEKPPTAEEARRWLQSFVKLQERLPGMTQTFATITAELAPLLPKRSDMDS